MTCTQCIYVFFAKLDFCRVNTRDRDDMEIPWAGDITAGDWLPLALATSEAVGDETGSETLAPLKTLPEFMLTAADGGLAGT